MWYYIPLKGEPVLIETMFNEETVSLLRNGMITTIGLSEIYYTNGTVALQALNSKKETATGYISVPKKKWYGDVVRTLLEHEELLPLLLGKHPFLDELIAEKLKETPHDKK